MGIHGGNMDEMRTAVLAPPPVKKHQNQYPIKVTQAKQQAYLSALAETGQHRQSCQFADIAENMPFIWSSKNDDFRKRREIAQARGEQLLLSQYESTLDDKVLGANTLDDFVKTQVIRMFRMKRLDPRYRDNAPTNVQINGPVAIQLNLSVQANDASNGTSKP